MPFILTSIGYCTLLVLNKMLYINYIALAVDPFLGPCYCYAQAPGIAEAWPGRAALAAHPKLLAAIPPGDAEWRHVELAPKPNSDRQLLRIADRE